MKKWLMAVALCTCVTGAHAKEVFVPDQAALADILSATCQHKPNDCPDATTHYNLLSLVQLGQAWLKNPKLAKDHAFYREWLREREQDAVRALEYFGLPVVYKDN
jgi:hypothetical protein